MGSSNVHVMQQWAVNSGSSNQQWQVNSAGGGYYTLTNRTSGLVLDLTGGGLGDGVNIQQWAASSGDINQQFQLIGTPRAAVAASPVAGQSFRIVNKTSGKPFGVAGASTSNGAQIVGSADDAALDQVWTLVNAGGGYFNLINAHTGLALDDTNGSTSNGTVMQQYTISGTGNSNQQWQITAVGNGLYTITNKTSRQKHDLTNGACGDGTPLQMRTPSYVNDYPIILFIPLTL